VVAQESAPPTVAEVRPAAPVAAQQEPPPQEKKKRGFWSRVFGVGRDSENSGKKPQK
jgi:hypothetical protein